MTRYRLRATVALCGALLLQNAMGASVAVEKIYSRDLIRLSITGEIERGDESTFAGLVKGAKQISVKLDSSGGDVDAAMAIGSLIRQRQGMVEARKCYSACVLIFAAGVDRRGDTLLDEPVVGVHRIFFGRLPPGLTPQQVNSRYEMQLKRVRSYLAEMNVAPEFLSFMQSIEPEQMRVLTRKQLDRYGLGTQDPAYKEFLVAQQAEMLGISSFEFRKRELRGIEECKNVTQSTLEPTTNALGLTHDQQVLLSQTLGYAKGSAAPRRRKR